MYICVYVYVCVCMMYRKSNCRLWYGSTIDLYTYLKSYMTWENSKKIMPLNTDR